jgi:hypothetical protein
MLRCRFFKQKCHPTEGRAKTDSRYNRCRTRTTTDKAFPHFLSNSSSGVSIIVIVAGLWVYVKKRKSSVVYKRRGYYIIDDLETIFGAEKGMLTHKNRHNETVFTTFNCRLCKVCFSNPYELRMHSMVQHKGHMLLSIKR